MTLLQALPINKTKLRVLFEIYAEGEDYLRNIEKKTKINPSLVHRILKSLKEARIINKKAKGKENYYELTKEGKEQFSSLLESFHLESVAQRTKEIQIFLKLLFNNKEVLFSCQNIYLFGSFVQGYVTKESDIDVMFITNEKKKVMAWCREASLVIGREVNPLIYTKKKFTSDLSKQEPLLSSIVYQIKNRAIIKS